MFYLAGLYSNQGRCDEAEPLFLETLDTQKRVLGDDHTDTLAAMNVLAWLLLTREPIASRDPLTALTLAVEVAEKTRYENPSYHDTLSQAYHLTGDTAKAIETQKKALLRYAKPRYRRAA
jgi:tetratricopeptide (TPR) repeat protein